MSGQINDGGPAFPGVEKTEYPSCVIETPYPGMSLRDAFAIAAMQSISGPNFYVGKSETRQSLNDWSVRVWMMADAMLEARKS